MSRFRFVTERPEILALIAGMVLHSLLWNYTVDDAYISFRYAENLIEGRGLVYNPGERVEGYTNFLWVLLVALPISIGLDPVAASKVLGLVASGALVMLIALDVGARLGRIAGFVAGLVLVADAAFALWTTAGLEITLFLLFVYLALRAVGQETIPLRAGLWGGMAALTRPEGLLAFAVLWVAARVGGRRGGGRAALLFAALVLPHILFRWTYYGELLPNTFYAKTGGSLAVARGATYLRDWLLHYGAWPLAAAALGGAVVALGGKDRRRSLPLVGLAAAFTLYVALIGGDGLTMFRFALFLLVPYLLLAAEAAGALARRQGSGLAAVLLLTLLVPLPARNSFAGPYHRFAIDDRNRVTHHWVQIGRWVERHALDDESVAVGVAGAIPFYAKRPTVDMLGITDSHIAHVDVPSWGTGIAGHEKHDMDYVLDRQPSFILHYPFLLPSPDSAFTVGQFRTEWNPGLADLLTSAEFDRCYRGEVAEVRFGDPQLVRYLAFFRRRPSVVKEERAGGSG